MAKAVKNFIACVLIIFVFTLTLFFIGWTQFKVKNGTVGVVVSKTSGVSENPVVPGKFSWHWEFLIPTNAELKIFSVKPYNFSKNIEGELPSAEILKKAFKDSPDFSYKFNFEITAAVVQERLPELLRSSIISDQESLEKYIESAVQEASFSAVSYLLTNEDEYSAVKPETTPMQKLLSSFQVAEKYPAVSFTSFYVVSSVLPDYKLYLRARKLYIPALNDTLYENSDSIELQEKKSLSADDKNNEALSEEDLRPLKKLLNALK